ncbi:MAG TPA: P-loop NTPase, partial [Smithellaceae bacterium]|nr:P-loop NTPase [Smithellaceae bacterium]
MILAVASGKGGTGKTTVSVNLARVWGSDVSLFDCDVEEPNAHLFLPGQVTTEEIVTSTPRIAPTITVAGPVCRRRLDRAGRRRARSSRRWRKISEAAVSRRATPSTTEISAGAPWLPTPSRASSHRVRPAA